MLSHSLLITYVLLICLKMVAIQEQLETLITSVTSLRLNYGAFQVTLF